MPTRACPSRVHAGRGARAHPRRAAAGCCSRARSSRRALPAGARTAVSPPPRPAARAAARSCPRLPASLPPPPRHNWARSLGRAGQGGGDARAAAWQPGGRRAMLRRCAAAGTEAAAEVHSAALAQGRARDMQPPALVRGRPGRSVGAGPARAHWRRAGPASPRPRAGSCAPRPPRPPRRRPGRRCAGSPGAPVARGRALTAPPRLAVSSRSAAHHHGSRPSATALGPVPH